MDNQDNIMEGLKEIVHKQISEAFMEGAHQGSITTCAVIYSTMMTAGLEADNFLFEMLKDLAKQHGCENLHEVAERLHNRAEAK